MRRSFCILVEGLLATMPVGEAGMVALHVAVPVVLLQEVLDVVAVVHLRLCALAVGAGSVLALLLLWLLCLLLLLLRPSLRRKSSRSAAGARHEGQAHWEGSFCALFTHAAPLSPPHFLMHCS